MLSTITIPVPIYIYLINYSELVIFYFLSVEWSILESRNWSEGRKSVDRVGSLDKFTKANFQYNYINTKLATKRSKSKRPCCVIR